MQSVRLHLGGFRHITALPIPLAEVKGETAHVLIRSFTPRAKFRMRSSAEIKKRVTGDIRQLNARLLEVSNRLRLEFRSIRSRRLHKQVCRRALQEGLTRFGEFSARVGRPIEESLILLGCCSWCTSSSIYFPKRLRRDDATIVRRGDVRRADVPKGMDCSNRPTRGMGHRADSETPNRIINTAPESTRSLSSTVRLRPE